MDRYKIVVAYDGTDYFGWQVQKERPSVAETLQDIFQQVFRKDIKILGASRTDAGVHALGQVATFTSDMMIQPEVLHQAWNNLLPPTIMIRSLQKVPTTFNPHRGVIAKTYWYHFFLERPLPVTQRYGWFYRYPLDIQKLNESLQVFVGEHDFRSFCTGNDLGDDTIRRIDSISLEYIEQFNVYRIAVTGPKFLRYMIRRIVGASMEVASRNDLSVADIKRIMEQKSPEHALPNAPAKGLVLYTIVYDSGESV